MTRRTRAAVLTAVTALALVSAGCSKGRNPAIAAEPGDAYAELSDLNVELNGNDMRLKVHYRFPENLPHPDAWFRCVFEVQGGRAGTVTVRKRGRELAEEGDFEATSNAMFMKRQGGAFTARVQQAKSQGGPYHDVSERLVVEF